MRLAILLATALLMVATLARADTTSLAPVDCWFAIPQAHGARCYHFTVPASRDGERDGSFTLPVAVLSRAGGSAHADPVVYLTGGPGSSVGLTIDEMPGWWSYFDKVPWLAGRDLVLMDQRGSGLSRPSLDCPEVERAGLRLLKLSGDRAARRGVYVAAADACRERLVASGLDLDDFGTEATAEDFLALVGALGIESWSIYSVSYGTRIALALMRHGPPGLRAAVLDSVYPPDERAYENRRASFDAALDALSRACALRESCRADFPDLRAAIDEAVSRYARSPKAVSIVYDGETANVAFTGAALLEHLFYLVIEADAVTEIAVVLHRLKAGEQEAMKEMLTTLASYYGDANHFGEGKYFAVDCQEEVPFADAARLEADIAAHPLLDNYGIVAEDWFACAGWVRPEADATIKAAVTSGIPAVVLQGTFDAITPVEIGRRTASRLARGFYLEFAEVGHKVVDQSVCGQRMAAAFFDRPDVKPSDPCLAAPPERPTW